MKEYNKNPRKIYNSRLLQQETLILQKIKPTLLIQLRTKIIKEIIKNKTKTTKKLNTLFINSSSYYVSFRCGKKPLCQKLK